MNSSYHPAYVLRAARPGDLDCLVDLLLALQDHLEEANPTLWRKNQSHSDLKGQLAGRLEAPDSYALVAEHVEDGVVGVIFGRIVTNKRYIPPQAGQIDQAFVHAGHRRAGVGSRLVAELCRIFAARGVADLSLRYVMGNEEAAAFWTALGFAPRIVTAGATRKTVEERLAITT